MDGEVFVGSANPFADVGIPDAEERLRKAPLALAIRKAIEEDGLTQEEAAARMGLNQPEVSRIVRGRLVGFTMDRLFACLVRLGRDVDVFIGPKADHPRAHLTIHYPAKRPTCTCERHAVTA